MTPPAPPSGVQRDVSLARFSTIRTGGPAQYFARAGSEAQLAELLAWARAAGVQVSVIGSGSNLLVADERVAGNIFSLVNAGKKTCAVMTQSAPASIALRNGTSSRASSRSSE